MAGADNRPRPGGWAAPRLRARFLAALPLAVLLLTAGDGCDRHPPAPPAAGAGPMPINLDPTDRRILAYVAWLNRNGVTLENVKHDDGAGSAEWRVVQPRNTDAYDVVFYLGSFPPGTPVPRMEAAVKDTNLAYLLNAPAHLAMSHGGTRGNRAEAQLPRSTEPLPTLNGLPITQAVEQLFARYQAE